MVERIELWQDIPQRLLHRLEALEIQTVHANIEYGYNESQRDQDVSHALAQQQKKLHLYHDRCIFHVGTLLNKSQQPYKVFGAFKKKCI